MTELKPCPFCRSDVTKEYPAEIKHEGAYFNVWARCCDFYGPLHDSEEQAIAAWNHRATPAPAQPDPLHVANERGEGWQPIEQSQPAEGDTVICWAGFTPYLAFLEMKPGRHSRWDENWSHDGQEEQRPTHWMPLPPPPAAPKEKP